MLLSGQFITQSSGACLTSEFCLCSTFVKQILLLIVVNVWFTFIS